VTPGNNRGSTNTKVKLVSTWFPPTPVLGYGQKKSYQDIVLSVCKFELILVALSSLTNTIAIAHHMPLFSIAFAFWNVRSCFCKFHLIIPHTLT